MALLLELMFNIKFDESSINIQFKIILVFCSVQKFVFLEVFTE